MARVAEDPDAVGARDLAVLVRAVLRAEAETSGANKALTVPATYPWPTPEQWQEHGFEVVRATPDDIRVSAQPWMP